MKIPESTTHVWKDALELPTVGYGIKRLAFYRKNENQDWEVYSEITNWRASSNPSEWFEEETRLGLFVPVGEIQ